MRKRPKKPSARKHGPTPAFSRRANLKTFLRAVFARFDLRSRPASGFCRPIRDFANETLAIEPLGSETTQIGARVECIANAAPSAIGADGWTRLAVYGDHPYGSEDIQSLDREAAEGIVRRFRSAANSLFRAIRRGSPHRPVYSGHPDHPQFSVAGHDDFTLQAEITDIEARDDGLYIKPVFTDAGNELLASGQKLYWSPRWVGELVRKSGGRRIWQPYKLLSAGLTPAPNIYGSAANAKLESKTESETERQIPMKELLKKLMIKLGFSAEDADKFLAGEDGAPAETAVEEKLDEKLDAANAAGETLAGIMRALGYTDEEIAAASAPDGTAPTVEELTERLKAKLTAAETAAADQANAEAKKKIDKLTADMANERRARAALIVERALEDGRLPAAEKEAKIAALAKAENFADQANALLTAAKILPSGGKSAALGQRKGEMAAFANQTAAAETFNAALAKFAEEQGLDLDADYQKVYARFKATPKGAELYEAMNRRSGDE